MRPPGVAIGGGLSVTFDALTRAEVMRLSRRDFYVYQKHVEWLRSMVDALDRADVSQRATRKAESGCLDWWLAHKFNLKGSPCVSVNCP